MYNDLYQMDVLTMQEMFIEKGHHFIEATKMGKSSHILNELHSDLSRLFLVIRDKWQEVPQEENLIY